MILLEKYCLRNRSDKLKYLGMWGKVSRKQGNYNHRGFFLSEKNQTKIGTEISLQFRQYQLIKLFF